jgi:hypothetical protein
MTDRPDILPDLAALLMAVLQGRHDAIVYAERVAPRAGIGKGDSSLEAEMVLRRVLGIDALHAFTETWSELMTSLPDSYGCEMNCPEANAAEELWLAAGDEATADAIADAHAEHDTEEDEHYRGTATAAGEGN